MAHGEETHFIPATLALCQFCQKHGPAICFTTQSLPHPTPNSDEEPVSSSFKYDRIKYNDVDDKTTEKCCRILPPTQTHIVSHETRSHRTYISTTSPPQHDYPTVKDGATRANNENCAANDIVVMTNNRDHIKSSVITRIFHIKDKEARGQTRKLWLMMVLSDRFAALDYVPDLLEMFGDIIRFLSEKSRESYDSDLNSGRRQTENLRSMSELLKFDDMHMFMHQKFTQIIYSLETKHLPLTIVPPGKIDELSRLDPVPCFCYPPSAESSHFVTRDRAETLVEPPVPKFDDIEEISDMLKKEELQLIIQQIVCGNQTVVRGQHPATIDSILAILTTFLPHNCIKNFGYGTKYEPLFCCNFLGLPLNVEVPPSGDCLVVDVMACQESPQELKNFTFKLRTSRHTLMDPLPKIVHEMMELVTLSKSQFRETYVASRAAVIQKWASKAMSYFLAMKTMLDAGSNEGALLGILQANRSDVHVLKFFKGSLKHHEKNKLLNEVQ